MSDRLTQNDILRFAYGEADELEDAIMSNPEYLAVLEEVWASELPHDLSGPVVRGLQMQKFVSDTLGTALDVAIRFGEAIPHYLAAGDEEDETPEV